MRTRIGVVIAALLVSLVVSGIALAKQMDPTSYALMTLTDAAQCDAAPTSPFRVWCLARGFHAGTADALPVGKVLFGFAVQLDPGVDAATALRDKVTLAALTVGGDKAHPKAKLVMITPSNDADSKSMLAAIANIALVYKDKATSAPIPADLASYTKSLTADYAVTAGASGWEWTGANSTELRKVGKYWVAIELGPRAAAPGQRHPPMPTMWVTILTDAWK